MRRNLFAFLCACAVALTLASSNGAALAAGLALQGNRGVRDVPCNEIFRIKDGRTSLASSFGESGGGFIVNGNQV